MKDFKKGDAVRIYNHKLDGAEFLEGHAVIISKVETSGRYTVKFWVMNKIEEYGKPSVYLFIHIPSDEYVHFIGIFSTELWLRDCVWASHEDTAWTMVEV